MADTILSGDITVNYFDDNRRKQLRWTGSGTGTRTMNEVYSAMATLLDEASTGDDATCMTAETPVEYTVGLIDANDSDPWYITYECVQHLTGGALKTAGWTRTEASVTGIVVVSVTSNTIVTADIGFDITYATDNDSGTLLEVIEQGATDYLVIRPDSNAAGNSFDNTPTAGSTLTCNSNTATLAAASTTGEQIWANLFNVTPIDADAHVYMYQGLVDGASPARARIFDINDITQDWWSSGSFDRCIYIRDFKTAANPIIDLGNITVFSRKGNTLYDNFEVTTSTTSGGRNPIPLTATSDLNNTTGYGSITSTAVSVDTFSVGDEILGATSAGRAIITQIDNPGATATYHYYLIDDPQINFQTAAESVTNEETGNTGEFTKDGNAPASEGPALSTWFTNNTIPTAVHANTTSDIDDDGTAEGYGVLLDCDSNTLAEVYEWCKYVCRNGETGTTPTDGIEGEQYVGPTVFLEYSGSVTGAITEGNDVTQETSLATGIVVSHDTTLKQILLRDVRGTFATHATTETLTDNDSSGTVEVDTTAEAFNAVKAAPFGTLAGGRWFGARGVTLVNWVSGDENDFQQIDSQGTARQRPIAITLSISNLVGTAITDAAADYVVMHRLTGVAGAIDKTEHNVTSGVLAANTIVVDTAIPADVPGKSTGGALNIRDVSDDNNHIRIRFASWASSTFTLAEFASFVSTATTNLTQITYATGGFNAAVERGDLVYNVTRGTGEFGYVETVDSDTQLTLVAPGISTNVEGDSFAVNVNPIALSGTDDLFVSLIDEYPTGTSSSVSIVYDTTLDFRVKVANTRATVKIKRFVTDGQTTGGDVPTATIRNTDTIFT